MSFVAVVALCANCRQIVACNPRTVPSFQGDPVCEACMARVNERRRQLGREPFAIAPDAYEACDELEL